MTDKRKDYLSKILEPRNKNKDFWDKEDDSLNLQKYDSLLHKAVAHIVHYLIRDVFRYPLLVDIKQTLDDAMADKKEDGGYVQ